MPRSDDLESRRAVVNQLASAVNLPEIAEALGLRLVARGTTAPKALCPFHEDKHPSLQFFASTTRGRQQFHCFSCGAHGDVFDLIKKQRNVDFRGALDWLAAHSRIAVPAIPTPRQQAKTSTRIRGLDLGLSLYRQQGPEERADLERWAGQRGFASSVLNSAEVYVVHPPKISRSPFASDREQFDALEDAGLLMRDSRAEETAPLSLDLPPRDFFSSPRVVFTIRDHAGKIAGFAGRTLGTERPKYLFSPRFLRGSTLYRWHKFLSSDDVPRNAIKDSIRHLFVVEGLMDALRLESLGLDAVAILSSNITDAQVELIAEYANRLDRADRQLAVHLMLDADEAGRRGAANAIPRLLEKAAATSGLLLDVVAPFEGASSTRNAHDPDELLLAVKDRNEALRRLTAWCQSPMCVLLATALDLDPSELNSGWDRISENQRLRAFHDVERRLISRASWINVLDRTPAFQRHLGGESQAPAWQLPLSAFLRASVPSPAAPMPATSAPERSDDARLVRALQIAEASTQRREFPSDEGSWDRLESAIDVTLAHLKERLAAANDSQHVDEPMLAVRVPKGQGKFRLKSIPCPEVLTLQQYVLDELLRDYATCPRFQRILPAVRFSASARRTPIETTGRENLLPANGETVSFAYMLDMDVVEQLAAPKFTGMFRPYYDCWREFISHIDRRVQAFPPGRYHVARLDIRSFYENVPRAAVNAVLLPAVKDALAELADSTNDALGACTCAPLFLPGVKSAGERAEQLVDWLCIQSFDYEIEDPGDGKPRPGERGLPQGPDLSAYLANVSLFPLDKALSMLVADLDDRVQHEHGEQARGGVYARYVDDMVIIARSASDLARLRAAVENQLALLGMELSPKTDALPVMEGAEVREWLTARRGAGLGVSGPYDFPPMNAPLAMLEPLADGGELDRSDSLGILYDPRLNDPQIGLEELAGAVLAGLRAPDLRHGDLVTAARHLWRCALGQAAGSADAAVAAMLTLWKKAEHISHDADTEIRDNHLVSDLLAWLDGVNRFLSSRQDRSPTFSQEQHRVLKDEREKLATLVHNGLCEGLINRAFSQTLQQDARKRFEHMLQLKTLVVRRSAAIIVQPPSGFSRTSIRSAGSRAKARLLISLAEAEKSTTLLDSAEWRAYDVPLRILFHESVARLRIIDKQNLGNVDPLVAVKPSMESWRKMPSTTRDSKLGKILDFWMPDRSPSDDTECAEIALGALVNLTPLKVVQLLEKRPTLKSFALDGSMDNSLKLLPTPPGIEIPGLLALRDEFVLRVDFRTTGKVPFCPTLAWVSKEGDPAGRWKRYEAKLAPLQYLPLPQEKVVNAATPRWLAAAFRSLAKAERDADGFSCPPTAMNLIGPAVGNETASSKWNVLGFCALKSRLASQAFRRQGDSLALEPVLEQHADLWRIGTALADWLGRCESTRNLISQRLSAPSLIAIPGEHWAREEMLRFSLYKLRGNGLPTRPLRLSPVSHLPMVVERVLRRLETFPVDDIPRRNEAELAHLVATLIDGRAIQLRIESQIDPGAPGGAVALLAQMARGQLEAQEELGKRLPSVGELPAWAPIRRPARALFSLAQRLELLVGCDPEKDVDPTLRCHTSGAYLLAIEANLRAQALEFWSLLDSESREHISESPPSLAEWELDGWSLLRAAQPEDSEINGKWGNVRGLFQDLIHATAEGQLPQWHILSSITPLGWLVILGSLSGVLQGERRRAADCRSRMTTEDLDSMKKLAALLALAGNGDDDLPWGGLSAVAAACTIDDVHRAFHTMRRIDVAAEFDVRTPESPRFQIEPSRRGPTEVLTSDGLRELQGWSINWARTIDESRSGTERVIPRPNESRAIFRWSETWWGDRLLGIGVVQSGMAALAGDAFRGGYSSRAPVSTSSDASPSALDSKTSVVPASSSTDFALAPEPEIRSRPTSKAPDIDSQRIQDALHSLRSMQDDSWSSRQEKPEGHARVALLQLNVDESYRHPAFELCEKASPDFDKRHPGTWNEGRTRPSCAEARRRAILKSALKACYRFNVEMLVLPEYSIRPETIAWLETEIPAIAPKTSVWAGTYRLPPGMQSSFPAIPNCPDWSAVHELVSSGSNIPPVRNRLARTKKYPAPAADEVFNPFRGVLRPLFADQSIGDFRSYTMELICSEVFLVTCPANLRPLARARRDLLRKFGQSVGGSNLNAMIDDDIVSDIKEFSIQAGISEHRALRRTLLFVPAMTSRSADYTVLGQAAFLSSGITTVFCNAVLDSYGDGQSCFIGHDGWQADSHSAGTPGLEPYHGERPGIFRFTSGQLRKEDQALVIADVDPVYGCEGRPRPQTLLKPLRLVAHLPIIESWLPDESADANSCRCGRSRYSLDALEFSVDLLPVLQAGIQNGWKNTIADTNPGILRAALWKLASPPGLPQRADQCNVHWLRKRADAYLAGHAADPAPWPPPVAVDWLWVDIGAFDPVKYPKIEAPPYAEPSS